MLWWLLIERRVGYGCGDAVGESGRVAGVTAAQDQVREQQAADRERIAKLEGQFNESDKRGATKADIADVRVEVESVRTEVEKMRTEVEKVRTEVAGVKKDVGVNRWLLYLVLSGLVLMLFRVFAGGFP